MIFYGNLTGGLEAEPANGFEGQTILFTEDRLS
jgi:hypothetical protein